MSEKLKLSFTPIPNVILDSIMRGLNEGEFKTLMAICRFTYGWGKQSDRISLAQLASLTGMDRSNVARARKRLGDLVIVIPGSATTASIYRLNIEIPDADLELLASDPSATSDHSAASVKGSDPSATIQRKPKKEDKDTASSNGKRKQPKTIPDEFQRGCVPSSNSKKKNKPADPAQLAAFAEFYRAYPRHVARTTAEKAWLELNPDPELTARIMSAVQCYAEETEGTERKFIKHPQGWLNAKRWEDEREKPQTQKEPKFVNA